MVKVRVENINPKGKKTADCVIRAISKASGKDYWQVAEDLFKLQKKTGYMLNEKRCYEKLLDDYGFIKKAQPRKLDNTKYLVGEIDKLVEIRKPKSVVISMASHLTCYINNEIVDLWDCRYKTIGNYWLKF